MNYPISEPVVKDPLVSTPLRHIASDRSTSVDDDVIVAALAGVIETAQSQGQSLDDVIAQVLADDCLLEPQMRHLLGDIVTQAWQQMDTPLLSPILPSIEAPH